MLEILDYFQSEYRVHLSNSSEYEIDEVIRLAHEMLVTRIVDGSVFDQDVCYAWIYLVNCGQYLTLLDSVKERLKQLLNALLTTVSEELLSMHIDARPSTDLARIHLTLCLLASRGIVSPKRAKTYVDKIESILIERQDVDGNWRNISETAEIASMILDGYSDRMCVSKDLLILDNLISRSVEAIYSQFGPQTNLWGDDIAATAKSIPGLTLVGENVSSLGIRNS